MKSKAPKKPQFSIKLTIADKVYQGKGETALDALQTLPKPEKIMYKGTLELFDGEKTKSILLYPIRLKRLFYNKYFQSIQIKQLIAGMK
jgi:hypothetical protein